MAEQSSGIRGACESLDAASALRLQIAKVAGSVVLSFEAQPQVFYVIQTNTSF